MIKVLNLLVIFDIAVDASFQVYTAFFIFIFKYETLLSSTFELVSHEFGCTFLKLAFGRYCFLGVDLEC